MHSGMYHGVVAHVRKQPTRHSLRYRLCMFYLDLDELPQVLSYGRLASADRRAVSYTHLTLPTICSV